MNFNSCDYRAEPKGVELDLRRMVIPCTERDSIMAWASDGCREWQRVGLKPPRAVSAATEAYFEAEDALGRWLDEKCERGPNFTETSAALFAAWKAWAEANGEFVASVKWLSENLVS